VARERAPAVAFLLLAAAGAGFGWLGFRSVSLERREAGRRDRARAEEALAALESAPLVAPPGIATTWTLVAARPAPLEGAPEDVALVLREADHRERFARDDTGAVALLAHLVETRPGEPLARVAAARGGAIARRRGDGERARALLAFAAEAAPDLADPDGPLVRAMALRHLAALEDATGASARLLEEARGGLALRGDLGLDAGDALAALAADAAGPADADLRARIAAAAATARRGHRALAALREDGRGATDEAFAWREGHRLHAVPLGAFGALFPSVETTFGVRVGVAPEGRPLPGDAVASRSRAFGPLVVHARPATPSGAEHAWWPVAAGLAVYVLGAALAAASIARRARVARMQGDFVAAVSHEMKTPVAAVQAMAERLADGLVSDPERARAYAARIHAEAARLGASVRNVLDASRIERDPSTVVRTAPVDPGPLVVEVVESLRPVLEARGFRVDLEAAPAGRVLAIDSAALRGVLENLLDNAAKHSGEGREVSVRAGPRPGGYRVEVLDRGPGVAVGDRERVFQRFFRGDVARRDAVPGVGLGLHVARALVVAHGGSLTVSDRAGGGAAFAVDLPEPVA
jgi:signal transduction histidine kinase